MSYRNDTLERYFEMGWDHGYNGKPSIEHTIEDEHCRREYERGLFNGDAAREDANARAERRLGC